MSLKTSQNAAILFWLVCLIYFCTGLTALAYEVLWARILSTLFGVSIFGVVVTISAFLAGLGVGSIFGKRFISNFRSPLRVFAFLEVAVALFAFNLPSILGSLDNHLVALASDSFGLWIFLQAIVTFALMFIPAFALGIGFPMILATLSRSKINVGTIYALNTLGGVIGALLPLLLLPLAGWTVSVRLVAIFAIVLAICAFAISFLIQSNEHHSQAKNSSSDSKPRYALLGVYACIGAAAIMLEIGWTRLYGMIMLRTEYVMAVILATFLVGIGLGSLLASRVKSLQWLILLPILVCFSALLSLYSLPWVSEWAEVATFDSLTEAMVTQGLIVALITLPATLAFGAWFPMLVAVFAERIHSGSALYGFNSVGAAAGGLIAGFLILPLLGTAPLILLSMLLVLIVSFYWLKNRAYQIVVVLAVLLAIPVIQLPSINQLLPESQANAKDLYFYEDAMTLTHIVEEPDGERILLADLQRMDASSEPTAVRVQKNQARLPLLLHPNPQNVLFLGLGTGITAAGTLAMPQLDRTAVELSKGAIIAATTHFKAVNGNISKHVKVIRDDARRYLKVNDQTFDVIVGDLFHPDLVGRSELLSLQQFERARARLNQQGIFVQWLALNQFDLNTLKVVLATFENVFPDGILFVDGFRLAMVGINGKFAGLSAIKGNLAVLSTEGAKALSGGEGVWSWAARYWGPIPVSIDKNKIQDEWAPVIEFQLPKTKFNRQNHLQDLLKYLLVNRPSVIEAKQQMSVTEAEAPYFEQARMANDMYYQSWLASFTGQMEQSQRLLSMAYSTNPDDQWIGFGMADAMFASLEQAEQQGIDRLTALQRILEVRPDHIGALKALQSLYLERRNTQEANEIERKIKQIAPLMTVE